MSGKQLGRLFALLFCALFIGSASAVTERYDYDPLGRLIRAVNEANQVTDYVYDAAGNLLEVRKGGAATAPAISGITPASLRRGETKVVTITGSGLLGASVAASDPELDIANLKVAATKIEFDLSASATATVGPQTIMIASAAGNASANITVAPLLPKVNVDPAPLAIPPDNVLRQFTVRLSHIDVIDHVVTLSASNSNITVSPSSITIPAGQISVPANIKGVTVGQSVITLSSTTLGVSSVPVFVTGEFVGITTSLAPMVGVILESPAQPKQTQVSPVVNPLVGVIVGSALRNISPDHFNVATEAATLTINGMGLEAAQTVAVEPVTGVTLGSPSVAPGGTTIVVPITVAADAAVSQRRVIVRTAAGVALPAASPTADRISIVRTRPQIDSIEPLFGTPDTTFTLTVRGRNLHEAKSILFAPSTGIATDATPVVNSDGTVLTARVALELNAAIGDYAVAVITPGGTSSAVAGPTNTFKVVNAIQHAVTPIVASAVGVVVEGASIPSPPIGLVAPAMGVTVGPVARGIAPAVGIVGQDITLTIQGTDLNGVTGVNLVPNTGLSIGTVTVAPDGKSVAVPVTIAGDASQTVRKVKVMAGSAEIPFVSLAAAQFRVSLPIPELDSITPITLQTGQQPLPLVVRGRNFQNASAIKITPANDMTVTTPPVVNGDGTEISVNVSAAANALPGARLVTVVTPAGESSAILGPTNKLTLSGTAGSTFTPVTSSLLGVVKLDSTPPPPASVGPVLAPALGLVLQEVPVPVSTTTSQFANSVGVAVGATALSLDANGFAPGFSGSLTVLGHELNNITGVSLVPATGITFGSPSATANGRQVSVPMTVEASASRGSRILRLSATSGEVGFANPAAAQLRIGPGVPRIDSITPILGNQGEIVSMSIRGSNFHDAMAVTATPSSGIEFVPSTLVVNANGTELTVSFTIDANAPLGSRVIQVLVPGASSDAAPAPANTFTVFPP